MQNKTIEQEIQRLFAHMDGQHEQEIHDMYVLVVRESADTDDLPEQIIETTLTPTKTAASEPIDPLLYATGSFFLFLAFSCILFQLYVAINPPIATVTIIPKSQVITLTGTEQLGRVVSPITLSQSQTVPTTGTGYQDPRAATGYITFFNGQLTSVTVPAGTVITSASGIQIVTDQDAAIPPADPRANPPIFGQVTISVRATNVGTAGNMAAYAINQPCCSASVIAKNMTSFTGGQDKRNFHTVSKADIGTTATALKTTLTESMHGALQAQLRQGEALQTLPCAPTVSADHRIGQEAAFVKVTASERCSAAAYNNEALISKATDLLSHQATQRLGTGYSLIGTVQVRITQATATPNIPILIFSCQGTWVYALSQLAQQQIKHIIAGKPRREAITLLVAMPGIATATVGGDDQTKLPKSLDALHLSILIPRATTSQR